MKVTRLKNEGFKTNEIAIFLSVPLNRETITKNALIPKVLRRGSANYKNQLEIGKKLENMYGASMNCGIDKTGDYAILKFYIETICDKFLPEEQNLAQEAMNLLTDIIFNPFIYNDGFNEVYVNQEKDNLEKIINSRKDNKSNYAFNRCIEEMFEDKPYGLYKFGYVEDLENIDNRNLYEYYKEMIKSARIDVYINGIDAGNVIIPKINGVDTSNIEEIIINETSKSTNNITIEDVVSNSYGNETKPKIIKEKADVTQGKLIIGLNVPSQNKYAATMYNVVLGGGANSKLFQNVREKASLAYSVGSKYIRRKDAIFIVTGIELQNYDKALEIIEKQLEDMKNGNITDDEIEAGKQLVMASLKLIPESQEDTISFYYDQNLFDENLNVNEYMEMVSSITKEQIIEVAKQVCINTIYYLEK